MSLAATDFREFLAPDSEIPPDVTFLVQTEQNKEGQEDQGSSSSKSIKAHRQFLACVSPVFRGMFFGPMKEASEVIIVTDTTAEAFETMVNYIYNPLSHGDSQTIQINCPQKLIEVHALATKYQLWKLVTLTSEALNTMPITMENMIFTATVAKNYKAAFEDLGSKMLLRCLKFLFDTISDAGDVCELIRRTADHFPEANLEILRELVDVGYTSLQLPGWGKLLFFDVGEHSTNDVPSKKLAEIPKLGTQWRVMYDFKPTATAHASKFCPSFALGSWENEQVLVIEVACTSSSIILGIDRPGFETRTVASNRVPEVGQWTRIEISHEERDGKYFLALSVGGQEVEKTEAHPDFKKLADVELEAGGVDGGLIAQPGFIRRLAVIGK